MRSSRFAQFALILALLFVQSAALAHAAEHPFHEQDAHCALFKVVDSQGHALAPSDLVSTLDLGASAPFVDSIAAASIAARTSHPARAPPAPPSF